MRIIFALVLILAFSFSGMVYAAEEGLVPCGGPGEDPCTVCHLFQLISNIVNFIAFRFAPIVGALLFVYAGIMMITSAGNPGKFQAATKIFWNVIIGLAIIYGAWLITNSIIQAMASKDNNATNWYNIDCTSSPAGGSGSSRGTLPTSGGTGTTSGGEEERTILAINDIEVNKDECPPGVPFTIVVGGCTSLEGIRPEVIDGTIDFKNRCDCTVVVTGGTEPGHETGTEDHAAGYKIDIDDNPGLDSYIEENFEFVSIRGDGALEYRDPETGAIWAREGTHWDVKGWDANYRG